MGTVQDHRRWAEECLAMARAAGDLNDKALWITLAQSWARLAEHVAHAGQARDGAQNSDPLAASSSD